MQRVDGEMEHILVFYHYSKVCSIVIISSLFHLHWLQMEEYLPQSIHSGSRKKPDNLTIPAENVLPRPGTPRRLCLTDFAHILTEDAETNSEKSREVSNPYVKPFRSYNRKNTGRQKPAAPPPPPLARNSQTCSTLLTMMRRQKCWAFLGDERRYVKARKLTFPLLKPVQFRR